MKNNIFDLEQQIMQCWGVIDDIDLTTKYFVDDPKWDQISPELCDSLMNKYFAIKELYELKFEKLWDTFETLSKEYHLYRKLSGEDRDEEIIKAFLDLDISLDSDYI